MELSKGYNRKAIKDLCYELEAKYNSLGTVIYREWPVLTDKIATEWIGPDEINFEKILVTMIRNFYNGEVIENDPYNLKAGNMGDFYKGNFYQAYDENGSIYAIIQQTMNLLVAYGNFWITSQNNPKYDGEVTYIIPDEVDHKLAKIEPIQLNKLDILIKPRVRVFSESQDLGLRSENSAEVIRGYIFDFSTTIVNEVKSLESILNSIKNAFSGDYVVKINELIIKLNEVMVNFSNIIKEDSWLSGELYNLVGQENYAHIEQEISTSVDNLMNTANPDEWTKDQFQFNRAINNTNNLANHMEKTDITDHSSQWYVG